MAQSTYIARKGEDADLGNTTVTGTLAVSGQATITKTDAPPLKLAGAGAISPAAYAATGAAWADGASPAFTADQKYMLIDIGGTTYRIPLWANE